MSRVSVVIPTLDAGPAFERTLAAVRAQEHVGVVELLVIDSDSTDRTRERAAAAGARVQRIPRTEFNHGLTRNLGASLTQGTCVAFLTQDAEPADRQWLATLVEAVETEGAAGAYSRVLPRPDCSPLVERSVQGDLVFSTERLIKRIGAAEFDALEPFDRRVFGHFNNVASLVRRTALERTPFPEIPFGEDLAWGARILREGGALVFEPRSRVLHSHPSGLRTDHRRHRQDAWLLRTLFGIRNRAGWRDCLPAIVEEVRRDLAHLRCRALPWPRRLRFALYSPALRAAQISGQLAGSRLAPGQQPRFPESLPVPSTTSWADSDPEDRGR